jgi:hypothetical protein
MNGYLETLRSAARLNELPADLAMARTRHGWTIFVAQDGRLAPLECLQRHPDRIYADGWFPPRIDYMMQQLRPEQLHIREALRRLREQAWAASELQRRDAETRAEKIRLERRVGDPDIARAMEAGIMPHADASGDQDLIDRVLDVGRIADRTSIVKE